MSNFDTKAASSEESSILVFPNKSKTFDPLAFDSIAKSNFALTGIHE